MNIEDLTLKQIRELQNIFSEPEKKESNLLNKYIGEYVIVRSRNEGINAGILVKADQTGVLLKDARRIYYHKPKNKNTAWYEGVSVSGLSEDSKISCPTIEKAIIEDYSITVCSKEAKESIINHESTQTTC